ncbi:MAG: molybdenum cofactor biosynthesis protein MoaE [Crocinitomicaceae bacterium]|nr:molybdenum cofactor biosynthesis protein MoaE [Crocinitomicaceae bacterium]
MKKDIPNCFVEGPIPTDKIARSIEEQQSYTMIGAHDIFLGQVRADNLEQGTVAEIEYTANLTMANAVFHEISESAFTKFELNSVKIYHSLGSVKAGEICLFVFTSSKHRKMAMDACRFVVEEIKEKAPIFGKEKFTTGNHQWKVNT